MRLKHSALVFRMELSAYEPLQARNLHYLHKVALGIASHALHAVAFVFSDVLVVELVTVTVAFLYVFLHVDVDYS